METPVHLAPRIRLDWLEGETDGLIALTGGIDGTLPTAIAAGNIPQAMARCHTLARLFGDRLYIEIQRHSLPVERSCETTLIDMAYSCGIPLVATNEPYFAHADDHDAHD